MIASRPRGTGSEFCASTARMSRGKTGQECRRTRQIARPLALLGAGAGFELIVGREGCHAEGEAGEVDAARVDDDGSRPVPGGFGL